MHSISCSCSRSFLLVAAALALVACGDNDGNSTPDAPVLVDADTTVDAPPPREVHMSTRTLQAGMLDEAELVGGDPGDRAIIHLTAPTATLDWNIHAHPSGSTITVVEENDKMEVVFDFIPTQNTDWYLLLRNGGTATMDVQVKIELFGAMTFAFL